MREAAGDEPQARLRGARVHVAQFLVRAKIPDRADAARDIVAEQFAHQVLLALVAGRQHDQIGSDCLAAAQPHAFGDELVDVAKLRDEVMDESTELSGAKAEEFNPDPRHSFLPHMVATAKQAGIPLCFVRQKRYPLPDGTTPQSESLRRYIAQLRAWLESQGCTLIDLTNDPEPDQSMYNKPGDDHMRRAAKEKMTEIYARKLGPLLHR